MAKFADERIHERYMESEYDHIGEMNKVLSTISILSSLYNTAYLSSKQYFDQPCSQAQLYSQEVFFQTYL